MQKKMWDQVLVPRNHVSWDGGSNLSLEGSDTFLPDGFEEGAVLTCICTNKNLSQKRPEQLLRVRDVQMVCKWEN